MTVTFVAVLMASSTGPETPTTYPAWPRPMTTDAEGRFTVRGVGQNLHAVLTVHHPRFAHQTIQVDTDDDAESKTVTAALAPPQIVNVRVTYADTGQPVPHAPLRVLASRGRVAMVDESETDADGAGPHQFLAGGPLLRRHGLSPGGAAVPHRQRACRVAQGRARADPQHRLTAGRPGPWQGH